MPGNVIPEDLRRFLLARGLSVPHVEAIVLLRSDLGSPWDTSRLAARLYATVSRAAKLLADLCDLGIAQPVDADSSQVTYRPETPELASLMDQLEEAHSKHLVAITRLIHAGRDPAAEQFAAAFRFRKEP
ncbi:MAG: hypothetical protein ABI411_20195 [Tahibacter sp.]